MSRRPLLVTLAALALAGAPARAETIRVVIDRLVFSPAEIQAKVGDTIEWVNRDAFAHTATAEGEWEVMMSSGKSGRAIMTRAGDFDYFCRFHPNMRGRVRVAAK